MVNTKSTGNGKKNNKTKLISSIAMLLVATIMVVTSTYAWVVLSTAPEVTEITTTVGANGALEIKLNIPDNADDKNSIFRNIVEFTNSKYGLDKITLLPSIPSDNFNNGYLDIPQYGYDGLTTGEKLATIVGALDEAKNGFYENDVTGVRAVGSSSSVSQREIAFNNAIREAKNNRSSAVENAKNSLKNDKFTGIVIKMVSSDNPSYNDDDIEAINTIILGLEAAVNKLEKAYEHTIFAYAASDNVQDENVYSIIQDLWGSNGLTIDDIAENDGVNIDGQDFTISGTILDGINAFAETKATVATVRESYDTLGDSYTADDVNNILKMLVNKSAILVNGDDPANVDLSNVLGGALITMNPGAGVYVEIADQCGDYSVGLQNNITMETATDVSNPYLKYSIETVEGVGAPESDVSDMPMNAFYGYIIDLVFKTNAKTSNLLLQTEGIDRIDNNNPSESTMGGGSYMEFSLVEGADITNTQVIQIMSCFRIVFFDTDSNDILGNAYLDTDNYSIDADENVIAKLYMVNGDQIITALGQNTEEKVSVLVYLDAEKLENEHVSATTAKSITGVMNLQFASDADLVPMPYGNN